VRKTHQYRRGKELWGVANTNSLQVSMGLASELAADKGRKCEKQCGGRKGNQGDPSENSRAERVTKSWSWGQPRKAGGPEKKKETMCNCTSE